MRDIETALDLIRRRRWDPRARAYFALMGLATSRKGMLKVPGLLAATGRGADFLEPGPMQGSVRAAVAAEVRVEDDGAERPKRIAVAGAQWIERMFEAEPSVETAWPRGRPDALLLCVGAGTTADRIGTVLDGARSARVPRIGWHLGGRIDAEDIRLLGGCDFVFCTNERDASSLATSGIACAGLLPPAVQPRRHNPVAGSELAAQDPEAACRYLDGVPPKWASLQRQALGLEITDSSREAVRTWMDEETARAARRVYSVRQVFRNHSMAERLRTIDNVLHPGKPPPDPPLVSIIAPTRRPENIQLLVSNIARQSYTNTEVVLVAHGPGFDYGLVRESFDARGLRVQVVPAPESWSLGRCLEVGCSEARGWYLSKMDDDEFYGRHYLHDLVSLQCAADAAVVSKLNRFIYFAEKSRLALRHGSEYVYWTGLLTGASLTFVREVLQCVAWRHLDRGEDAAFLDDCFLSGLPVLAADRFNFVSVRSDPREHTWQISNERIESACRLLPAEARVVDVEC